MALSDYQKDGQDTHISVSTSRANSAPQSILFNGLTVDFGANTQLKTAVLDQSITDSPTEGRIDCQMNYTTQAGESPQPALLFRYQDLNNFYFCAFNGPDSGRIATLGKIEAGAKTVIFESEEGYFASSGNWFSVIGEVFLNSDDNLTMRLEVAGSLAAEATDTSPSLTSGGGQGLAQGGNGDAGFTDLTELDNGCSEQVFIDDITYEY